MPRVSKTGLQGVAQKRSYGKVLQLIGWALLFWFGSSGLGTLSGVSEDVQLLRQQVVSLQSENAALKMALDLTQQRLVTLIAQNEELQRKVEFLTECLTRRMPWPGQQLCPKPQLSTNQIKKG